MTTAAAMKNSDPDDLHGQVERARDRFERARVGTDPVEYGDAMRGLEAALGAFTRAVLDPRFPPSRGEG